MQHQSKNKRKILLIDDDTSLLVTLRDFLLFEGYDVSTAESGEQGLERLKTLVPDLVVLDMAMPGMGGVGFLKHITRPDGELEYPVLVLTARANMAEFFANVNVDGFVAKPCNPEDLLMEVGRIIFLRSGAAVGSASGRDGRSVRKVVLGEDDAVLSARLAAELSATGLIVDLAASGPELVEKAVVQKPDVVVVKHRFTDMDGDRVAELLRKMAHTRQIPVVLYAVAGPSNEDDRYMGLDANIGAVVRGSEAGLLRAAIDKIFRRRDAASRPKK